MTPSTLRAPLLATLAASMFAGMTAASAAREPPPAAYALCGDVCIVVDAQGRRIGSRAYDGIEDIVGDLVLYKRGERYGIANLEDRTLVAPTYRYLRRVGRALIAGFDEMPGESAAANLDRVAFYALNGRKVAEHSANADESLEVRAWRGNAYLLRRTEKDGRITGYRYEFFDGEGRTLAEFESFQASDEDAPLAVARAPGGLAGYVDERLRFVIAPRFRWAQPFENGIARVTLPNDGIGLIDIRGRMLIPPGRYDSAFAFESERYLSAYRKDGDCGDRFTRKGRRLRIPDGLCVHDDPRFDQPDVLIVKDAAGKFGAVDSRGRLRVPLRYDRLEYFDGRHLRVRDDGRKRYGLLTLRGEVALPAEYEELWPFQNPNRPTPLRDDRVIAIVGDAAGLLGLDGRWIVAPTPGGIEILDRDLIARSSSREARSLLDADGRDLGIVFKYDAFAHLDPPARFELHVGEGEGVIDGDGRWVLPPKFRDVGLRADGSFAVNVWDPSAKRILRGLYDRDVREILAPTYDDIGYAYVGDLLAVTTADWNKQLVDRNGRLVADWRTLTPELRGSGDPTLEAAIDPCFIEDPTAEPQALPTHRPGLAEVCADPERRARLRDTRLQAARAMAGDCLPVELHRVFDAQTASIAACTTASCVEEAGRSFAEALPRLIAQCPKARSAPAGGSPTVPAAVIRALRPQLKRIESDRQLTAGDYRYSWLDPASPRDGVVVWDEWGDPRYTPFHLFERDVQGRWRKVLSSGAGSISVFGPSDPAQPGVDWIATSASGPGVEMTYWRRSANGDFEPGLVCAWNWPDEASIETAAVCSAPAASALPAP